MFFFFSVSEQIQRLCCLRRVRGFISAGSISLNGFCVTIYVCKAYRWSLFFFFSFSLHVSNAHASGARVCDGADGFWFNQQKSDLSLPLFFPPFFFFFWRTESLIQRDPSFSPFILLSRRFVRFGVGCRFQFWCFLFCLLLLSSPFFFFYALFFFFFPPPLQMDVCPPPLLSSAFFSVFFFFDVRTCGVVATGERSMFALRTLQAV